MACTWLAAAPRAPFTSGRRHPAACCAAGPRTTRCTPSTCLPTPVHSPIRPLSPISVLRFASVVCGLWSTCPSHAGGHCAGVCGGRPPAGQRGRRHPRSRVAAAGRPEYARLPGAPAAALLLARPMGFWATFLLLANADCFHQSTVKVYA